MHDRVEERPNADVLRSAADQDRRHHAGPDGLLQAALELRVGDLLALEVLGHDVVVRLGRSLDQLIAAGRHLAGQVRRNRDLRLLAARHLVGLAMDEVHVAGERLGRSDRDVQRRDLLAERGPEGVQRVARVGILTVALVDEEERRAPVRASQRHRRLEAGLDVPRGIHQENGSVRRGEALDDLGREVRVPGGVDDLDPRSLVLQAGHRERQRLLALLFLGLVVQAGGAVVDAAKPRDGGRIEEEALGQRRLTGPGMGRNDDAAEVGEVDTLGCHLLYRSSGGVRSRQTSGSARGQPRSGHDSPARGGGRGRCAAVRRPTPPGARPR